MYSFIISQDNMVAIKNFLRPYSTMVYSTIQWYTVQYSNQHDTFVAIRRTVYLFETGLQVLRYQKCFGSGGYTIM
jgi:hypothetical protein